MSAVGHGFDTLGGKGRAAWAVAAALAATLAATAAPTGAFPALVKWSPLIIKGFAFNLIVSALAMGVGTIAGAFLGLTQISRVRALSRGGDWVIQFFRNAPWLVLLFYSIFLIPFEFRVLGVTVHFPAWLKAVIGLGLPVMANVAEIVRGAVQSIPTAQWESAASLGLNRRQVVWRVILPQCIKRMLPPWMNLYAIVTTASPLISIVGIEDGLTLTRAALNAEGRHELLLPFYTFLLLLFFVYCYPIALWTRRLEARYAFR
jgi:polar amino acid transport system permease protein